MSNEDSINQFYAWNGFVYVTPLLGGYIADTYLGRYKTILSFALIYLVGLVMFVCGTIPMKNIMVIFQYYLYQVLANVLYLIARVDIHSHVYHSPRCRWN